MPTPDFIVCPRPLCSSLFLFWGLAAHSQAWKEAGEKQRAKETITAARIRSLWSLFPGHEEAAEEAATSTGAEMEPLESVVESMIATLQVRIIYMVALCYTMSNSRRDVPSRVDKARRKRQCMSVLPCYVVAPSGMFVPVSVALLSMFS